MASHGNNGFVQRVIEPVTPFCQNSFSKTNDVQIQPYSWGAQFSIKQAKLNGRGSGGIHAAE